MSFATARVAPEKQFHRLPAVGAFCDVMEMDMRLEKDPATDVYRNETDDIVISQSEEECIYCGQEDVRFVFFSPARARLVAQEMLRLADEIEAEGE